jgi:tRNA (mo5U34)-methyltransferase
MTRILQAQNAKGWTPATIERRARALGKWFHNLHFGEVQTAPDHFLGDYPAFKWRMFEHAIPADLSGKSVLDIGCNAGFYSLEMKRRGAERVLGIDSHDGYLAQAKFAAEVEGVDIEFRKLSVYELDKLGEQFDWVIFMGVLYHLRHPLLALDLIHTYVARDRMLFQSMQRGSGEVRPLKTDYPFEETDIFDEREYPAAFFVEQKYAHDQTNWWIPNRACVEGMLRSSGFAIVDQPEQEVYICRKAEPEFAQPKLTVRIESSS